MSKLKIKIKLYKFWFKQLNFFLFFLGVLAALNLSAKEIDSLGNQEVAIVNRIGTFNFSSNLLVLKEESKSYSIEEIVSPALYHKFYTRPDSEDRGDAGIYWGRLKIKNEIEFPIAHSEWFLSLGFRGEIEIYTRIENGPISEPIKIGLGMPFRENSIIKTIGFFPFGYFPIRLPPGKEVEIFFRKKENIKGIPPNLSVRLKKFNLKTFNFYGEKLLTFGIFLGIYLIMAIYSSLLFFINKDKTYLYYTLYLFSIIIYIFFSNSVYRSEMIEWFAPNHPYRILGFRTTAYWALIFYLAFISSFLDLTNYLVRWKKIFKGIIIVGIILFFIDNLILYYTNYNTRYSDNIIFPYLAIAFLLIIVFLFSLYKSKIPYKNFVFSGSLVLVIGTITIFPNILDHSYQGSNTFYQLQLCISIDLIIFALGLSYKQKDNETKAHLSEKKELAFHQLQELDRLKTTLYTNITHEFRTPLTVILGIVDELKKNTQKEAANGLNMLERSGQNLLNLVNQLLDLSKVESGKMQAKYVQGDIVPFLKYTSASFQSFAQTKQIKIDFTSKLSELVMDYDPEKLSVILTNLIANAIKFSQAQKTIELQLQKITQVAKTENDFCQIVVRDNGIGIAAKELPHIFDRFYQIDNSATKAYSGTGIGLALVKEFVTLLEGTITVESQLNEGTSFIILFPIKQVAPLVEDFRKETFVKELVPPVPVVSKLTLHKSKAKLPILLIIEDNQDVLAYIQSIVQTQYDIHTAKNGEEGIIQAIKLIPDLIICDVMMPIKGGYEVCHTLKKEEKTSHIPIVLLTAQATQAAKIEGLKYGADAFLTKPFHREELILQIQQLIEMRRKLQEKYVALNNSLSATSAVNKDKEVQFLTKVHQWVNEHLGEESVGVAALAEFVNMSNTQLYRKLKSLTQQTPSQFIRSIRLREGKTLLHTTDLNIAEIAYKVGFSDPSYFTRVFLQEFGKSPRDFRNQL